MSKIYRFDFTLSAEILDDPTKIIKLLKEFCKKGVFSKELSPETEYLHYQGRVSLIKKLTIGQLIKATPVSLKGIHWSCTSNNCEDNDYVTKEYTRVDGPWNIDDEIDYIPKQIREIENLFDWQQEVINNLTIWDKRTINFIYCPDGNIGKSTLVGWIRAYKLGRALPPVNDYKDMLRIVCDLPTSNAYIIDMPRALKKDKLWGFYSAIETIKDGYAYDDRYRFREKIFDCPNIWIFSNIIPELKLLSADRWKIFTVVNGSLELQNNSLFEADFVL